MSENIVSDDLLGWTMMVEDDVAARSSSANP